ncbi:MAG TPA: DUF2332 domain-containing protein, partial [Streptosporangiaceae bacterium]|nr:DUF2332 domain-containing protein [Streptosporangiaceae bacterium]
KQQPNLLFAAARYLLGAPATIETLRALVRDRPDELAAVMMARRTQTNEPARCATLLPALAQLPEPLALIEVGASAGLTLLFDRYSYDYDGHRVTGTDPAAPVLRCALAGPVPLPRRVPEIVWRAGLDLNPLDISNDDDALWLSCLLWPAEGDREERLAAAIATARMDPPPLIRGDLVTDLPAVAANAPDDATLVIFHSSVLYYVPMAGRRLFAATIRKLAASRPRPVTWLSNEGPDVLPDVQVPPGYDRLPNNLQVRDGRTPFAVADPHGMSVRWLE